MQFMKNTYTITDINSVPTLVVLLEIGENEFWQEIIIRIQVLQRKRAKNHPSI